MSRKSEKAQVRKMYLIGLCGCKCAKCGKIATSENIKLFDFHHIEPQTKQANLSDLLHNASLSRILKEFSKCILVCKECHRNIHKKVEA